MRLIDADAITEDERQEHGFFYNSDLQELLDEQPTIDISNTSNTLGALDCVDRQKAIDESYQVVIDGDVFDVVQVETLMGLPSVQPRKGKWIGYKADDKDWQRDDGSPVFMNCSECHEAVINNGSAHWNFCPNCGCRMEEGDSDE